MASIRLVEARHALPARTVAISVPTGPGSTCAHYAPPSGVAMLPFAAVGVRRWRARLACPPHLALVAACAAHARQPVTGGSPSRARHSSRAVTLTPYLATSAVILLLPLALAWRWLDRPAGSIAQVLAIYVRPAWASSSSGSSCGAGGAPRPGPWCRAGPRAADAARRRPRRLPSTTSRSCATSADADRGVREPRPRPSAHLLGRTSARRALALLRRHRHRRRGGRSACGATARSASWSRSARRCSWHPCSGTIISRSLVLPAAFLAQRLHIAFVLLPLFTWQPLLAPWLVMSTTLLPFFARDEQGTSTASSKSSRLVEQGGRV